jgi:hypothetical protein
MIDYFQINIEIFGSKQTYFLIDLDSEFLLKSKANYLN